MLLKLLVSACVAWRLPLIQVTWHQAGSSLVLIPASDRSVGCSLSGADPLLMECCKVMLACKAPAVHMSDVVTGGPLADIMTAKAAALLLLLSA